MEGFVFYFFVPNWIVVLNHATIKGGGLHSFPLKDKMI